MLVLDTDLLTLIQNRAPAAVRLKQKIAESGKLPFVTIVTLEEQLRGRLAACSRATDPVRYSAAVRALRETFEDYRDRNLLDFDDRAAIEFKRLRTLKVRIGTMDLRIASIVLVHDATLITMNQRDYEKVPGLRAEDWTRG
jgi:tRNA(fMet)-specific endonuclease VapC